MIKKAARILSTPSIAAIFFLTICFSKAYPADVTLTVGDGEGAPGSSGNPVAVSLDNPIEVKGGLQLDICDVDNYLTPVLNDDPPPQYKHCNTTERTTSFECTVNELSSGCCRVLLFSTSESNTVIGEGTGSIFSLEYDVSGEAPPGGCRELNPEGIVITDVNSAQLDVESVPGVFCFDGTGSTTTTLPTTTTTVPTTTTSVPVTTTTVQDTSTTTTAQTSCSISISPLSASVRSGTALQFTARTECGGVDTEGSYSWQIVPER